MKGAFKLKDATGSVNWGGVANYASIAIDTGIGIYDNIQDGTRTQKIISDAVVDVGVGAGTIAASTAIGTAIGSAVPIVGNVVGAVAGFVAGVVIENLVDADIIAGKSLDDWLKEGAERVADGVVDNYNTMTGWVSGLFD